MSGERLVYLAQPIDQVAAEIDAVRVADLLSMAGLDIYDPAGAFRIGLRTGGYEAYPALQDINMAALEQCQALVVVWWLPVPSIGCVLEIEHAMAQGLPVYVLHDGWFDRSWAAARWLQRGLVSWSSHDLGGLPEMILEQVE